MSRIAYVNGAYVPHDLAAVHVEDRGYQFADGIYEVCAVMNGKLLDAEGHFARLDYSLGEIGIEAPVSPTVLPFIIDELLRQNRVRDGLLYIQVTRGVARRDHPFPEDASIRPSLVMTVRPINWAASEAKAQKGVAAITMPDERWARCDIKSTALLANVLAKQKAREAGAYEAWLVDEEGFVTEGSSSTAWIIDQDGRLMTRPLGADILPGITRQTLLEVASKAGIAVLEQAFTPAQAHKAREAFITSATGFVLPVVEIDGVRIGNGVPGSIATRLRELYINHIK